MSKNEQLFLLDSLLNWVQRELKNNSENPLEKQYKGPDLELNTNIKLNKLTEVLTLLLESRSIHIISALKVIYRTYSRENLPKSIQLLVERVGMFSGEVKLDEVEEDSELNEGLFSQGIFQLFGDSSDVYTLRDLGKIDEIEKIARRVNKHNLTGNAFSFAVARQQVYRVLHESGEDGSKRLFNIIEDRMNEYFIPEYEYNDLGNKLDDLPIEFAQSFTTSNDLIPRSILSLKLLSDEPVSANSVLDLADMFVASKKIPDLIQILPLIIHFTNSEIACDYVRNAINALPNKELFEAAKALVVRLYVDGKSILAAALAAKIPDEKYQSFAKETAKNISDHLINDYPQAMEEEAEERKKHKGPLFFYLPKMKQLHSMEDELWQMAVALRDKTLAKQCFDFRMMRGGTHELGNRINLLEDDDKEFFIEIIKEFYEFIEKQAFAKATDPYSVSNNQFFHEVTAALHAINGDRKSDLFIKLFEENIDVYLELSLIYEAATTSVEKNNKIPEKTAKKLDSLLQKNKKSISVILQNILNNLEEQMNRDRLFIIPTNLEKQLELLSTEQTSASEFLNAVLEYSSTDAKISDKQREAIVSAVTNIIWRNTIAVTDTYFEEILKQLEKKQFADPAAILAIGLPYVKTLIQKKLFRSAKSLITVLLPYLKNDIYESTTDDLNWREYYQFLLQNEVFEALTQDHSLETNNLPYGIDDLKIPFSSN